MEPRIQYAKTKDGVSIAFHTQRICVPQPTTPASPAPSSRTIAPRPSTMPPAPCLTSLIP